MGGPGLRAFGSFLAAVWLAAAAPAAGLESLSGTYELKESCKVYAQGAHQVVKEKGLLLPILDLGGGVMRTTFGTVNFEGQIRAETEKPSRGWLAAVACQNQLDGIIHFEVSMTPSGAVRVKGSLLESVSIDGSVISCQLRGKRISTDPPAIAACP